MYITDQLCIINKITIGIYSISKLLIVNIFQNMALRVYSISYMNNSKPLIYNDYHSM